MITNPWKLTSAQVAKYYETHPVITEPAGQAKYAKSGKGEGAVYQCGINFAPARSSRKWNLCVGASPQCIDLCLRCAGQNQWPSSEVARVMRTRFLMEHPVAFKAALARDLTRARARAAKAGMRFAFRFNTLSDSVALEHCPCPHMCAGSSRCESESEHDARIETAKLALEAM